MEIEIGDGPGFLEIEIGDGPGPGPELDNIIICKYFITGVVPGKSQNAVLLLYSIIFLCTVSKLKPKQYKSS